jgi:hypothetical protein
LGAAHCRGGRSSGRRRLLVLITIADRYCAAGRSAVFPGSSSAAHS